MNLKELKPKKSLNKAFLKVKPNRVEIEHFKTNLIQLIDRINDAESEEFHKNLVIDFLKKTYYDSTHFINTKGRNDLVIHNSKEADSTVGVIVEAKKPTNRSEMVTTNNLNTKAFQELMLYYLRERLTHKNLEIKHLIITNINEWFIFDATLFDRLFAQNKNLVEKFHDFENGRLADIKTDFFYKQIAEPLIAEITTCIEFTYFNLQNYQNLLRNDDKTDDNQLIALFKLLSPEHLLKLPFANDSNSLDKRFYSELLHIIGLTESQKEGKKLINRNEKNKRHSGTLLEDAISQLVCLDKISRLDNPTRYGNSTEEQLFNIALELSITWINRILFLKLLEAQLIRYHKGDVSYAFLHLDKIKNYDDLNSLFFQVLACKHDERHEDVKKTFEKIPYLNSSLFELTEIEHVALFISNLKDDKSIPIFSQTVLRDQRGKKRTGSMITMQYLFEFLDAYDFGAEGSEEIQEENKMLINASVLGLIFEKINGYKDGSFFTPGFITMYMCRETIRKAVVQKFNEIKKWNCQSIDDLYDKIEDRSEANHIVNSIKICDPAVGSGHFLVSALNEIIAIKSDLKILQDREGRRLKEYHFEVENDELIVTDEDGELFVYNPNNRESQRLQESLFHEKQTLIENCLFGVDINPNSVKICRLRLWIELLKNAYYKNETELETLPNIDINIKCGNSLISRFSLHSDLSKVAKNTKWNIFSYQNAVKTYKNSSDKALKHELERLIQKIKANYVHTIQQQNPKLKTYYKLLQEYHYKFPENGLFVHEPEEIYGGDAEKREKENQRLVEKIEKLSEEIETANDFYQIHNAFEWRFEFPEVLNDNGDFIGFDVVIGNPPYIQLSKSLYITEDYKSYLINQYKTSGGRLNTFIFFIHLSGKLLKKNGIFNFIIPNTILSQEYYTFTRDFLINKVSLTEIVNLPILPFKDAVVETVLIQFINTFNLQNEIDIKELSPKQIELTSLLQKEIVNKDSKLSFIYQHNPIIEKIYEKTYKKFGSICNINQGIALKGDKILSLKKSKENDKCHKLLDGRHIRKYSINWNNDWLDYDVNKIHSCKTKDIFEEEEKLLFRRVSSSLIFTYDKNQFYTLNTIVIVTKKKLNNSINLKFILGLMNSKLMNYLYVDKFKSTKKVFSEIQARSVKELPIPDLSVEEQAPYIALVSQILLAKEQHQDTTALERQIDGMIYALYGLTAEEIAVIEGQSK